MSLVDIDGITLTGADTLADVAELVTKTEVNWSVGSVAELRIDLADPRGTLADHGLLALGTQLTWGQTTWQVGSVDRSYAAWGVSVTIAARSLLAKTLRLEAAKRGSTKHITPGAWITKRAQAAGGDAFVQAGARKRTIVQKQGQTTLNVITNLASAMEADWVEIDGVLYVATPWHAFQDQLGLPTWPVTWLTGADTDALTLSGTVSDDDKTEAATCSVTLPFLAAQDIRPWHRVTLTGAGDPLDGDWLVGDVTIDLTKSSTVSLTLSRPLQTSIKRGSSGAKKAKSGSKPGGSTSTSDGSHGSRASNPVTRAPNESGAGGKHRPFNESAGLNAGWRYPRGGFHGAYDYGVRGVRLYAVRDAIVLACHDGVANNSPGHNPGRNSPSNWVLLGVVYKGRKATVYYQHMSPGLNVSAGQRIAAGHYLGRSGNTGNSTGYHLHIETRWGWGARYTGARIFPPSQVWA